MNSNPTLLPKHQTLSPNHQFAQRILYVECCSVYAHMAWSQKFRLTLMIQPPALLQNVLFLWTSVVQNVCVCILWTSCLRAKMHYYYMWPFAKKLYHGWISTSTSSNKISWKLPPPEMKNWLRPWLPRIYPGVLSCICVCLVTSMHAFSLPRCAVWEWRRQYTIISTPANETSVQWIWFLWKK